MVPRTFWDAGSAQSAFSLVSRSGPIVPVALAAASVWHPLQPDAPVNTALPAAAFPPDELAPEVLDDEDEDDDEDAPDDEGELEDEPAPGTTL